MPSSTIFDPGKPPPSLENSPGIRWAPRPCKRSTGQAGWRRGAWLAALAVLTATPCRAQHVEFPPYRVPLPAFEDATGGTGVVATGLLLRRLEGVKRVLMVGAHPDDESTTLLTVLARSLGAQTAYLSLTRGDGGQNLIGPELWEGLGVIRTGELEAARRIDGGEQFFTRAFDFGFSKSAEETLSVWPQEQVLADMLAVIRDFRPQVVISVWSGTPSDGHGHHQAAGQLALEAFRERGSGVDPRTGLVWPVWSASKFYLSERRRFFSTDADVDEGVREVVTFPAGDIDPLLGRSPAQISGASRSRHRSQNMGTAQPVGPRSAGAVFVEGTVEAGDGLFAGIDTTLAGVIAGLAEEDREEAFGHLDEYLSAVADARHFFGVDLDATASHLLAAISSMRRLETLGYRCRLSAESLREGCPPSTNRNFLATIRDKLSLTTRAYMAAAGIVVDVRASSPLLVPGSSVQVTVTLWNGSEKALDGVTAPLNLPPNWGTVLSVEGGIVEGRVPPGGLAFFTWTVQLPDSAEPSRVYYLREPRGTGSYSWEDSTSRNPPGRPRNRAPVDGFATFTPEGSGVPVHVSRPWRYVGVDGARGEFAKPVLVVPGITVAVSPDALVWPQTRDGVAQLSVVVATENEDGASGEVEMIPPQGWNVSPRIREFDLAAAGSRRSQSFELRPTSEPAVGRHTLEVVARSDGREYRETLDLIDYEHIERTPLYSRSDVSLSVIPVEVDPGLRVGYVMGSGDSGPEAIRQLGVEVEVLDGEQILTGDFARFDAIVLGVRAYETREEVRSANAQLVDYVRSGGTVINQYNQYRFSGGGFAPYRLFIDRPAARVSDESAPVTLIEPDAPIFTTPNRITQADFDGWVQERGLYFASEWGDEFTPVIELNDPGEPARRGALLVAAVGEGVYVYAALSFFRQWSERVPGAYRLFANLISLDGYEWEEFRGRLRRKSHERRSAAR